MSNRHWIKLWLAVLDDPKMGGLSDELWRLTIELFLVAGECGDDGVIPNGKALAWRLRRDVKTLQRMTRKLESVGILEVVEAVDTTTPKAWRVRQFTKRQSRVPDKLRKRAQRADDIEDWITNG
mgnify:CR=1 FL=1|tara:strand:- start:94 stop:465 length:372 start_codon:yes stop_codon:yes gene_type:complete